MTFEQQLQHWLKGEMLQGKIMIGLGILILIAFIAIIKSDNEFLRGALIPLGLVLAMFIGYGGYILYSRPAHVAQSTTLYQTNPQEAIQKEIEKHTNDNKAGKMLIKYVYPTLAIVSIIVLVLVSSLYYKGMAIGFALLFLATYVIDTGFVTRSNNVLQTIQTE